MARGWETDGEGDGAARPPALALAAGGGATLLAAGLFLCALLPPIAGELALAPAAGMAVTLAVHGLLALGLLAGTVGVLVRAAWGWWACALCAGGCALYQAKLAWFYARVVRWEHPRAGEIGLQVLLRYGLPAALALAVLACLCAPSVRAAVGLRQAPRARRTRRIPPRG